MVWESTGSWKETSKSVLKRVSESGFAPCTHFLRAVISRTYNLVTDMHRPWPLIQLALLVYEVNGSERVE